MSEITERNRTLEEKLRKRHINGAVAWLRNELERTGYRDLAPALEAVGQNYSYLYRYFLDGSSDDSRSCMLDDMSEQLRVISDTIHRRSHAEDTGAYFTAMRMWNIHSFSLPDLLTRYRAVMSQVSLAEMVGDVPENLSVNRYDLLGKIFNTALVSFHNNTDTALMKAVIENADNDRSLRVMLLHAMVLGMLAYFDADKLAALLDIILSADTGCEIKSAAYPGLVFILMAWGHRVKSNRRLMQRIDTLADNPEDIRLIRIAVKAIAGTRDTDRIAAKMNNEVLPEIMKMQPQILDKLKNLTADFDPETAENNPEWQELLDKSGITSKLEELAEMQSDGGDLMMVSFSKHKSHPFFRNIASWFLPFNVDNPDIKLDADGKKMVRVLTDTAIATCNSDKYSLALGLASIPEPQKKMIMSQFAANMTPMMENLGEQVHSILKPDYERDITTSVREYHRYFKQGRNVADFANPFMLPHDFKDIPSIDAIVGEPDFMTVLAEFYLKRGFHAEALPLFCRLARQDAADPLLWQKIGFCRQKTKDYAGARDAYMKAELLGDSSRWLLRKLAFTFRKLGNHRQALEYYAKALADDSENIKLIINAAGEALAIEDTATALRHYYHAEYLAPDNADVARAIAWTEMVAGNLQKSYQKYQSLLVDNPTTTDWLNAGHAALLTGRYAEAYERYCQSSLSGKSEFEMAIAADAPLLLKLGASQEDIDLMMDGVLYR